MSNSDEDIAGGSTQFHDPKECLRMKPRKSILKTQTSIETQQAQAKRPSVAGAHFDEMNIVLTHHPADKDYGHMKIDEPKTPYHSHFEEMASVDEPSETERGVRRVSLSAHDPASDLAGEVAHRIASGSAVPRALESDEEDPDETAEERQHRIEFERKRRDHYNEGQKMREAKALVQQELKEIEQMEEREEEVKRKLSEPSNDMHTA